MKECPYCGKKFLSVYGIPDHLECPPAGIYNSLRALAESNFNRHQLACRHKAPTLPLMAESKPPYIWNPGLPKESPQEPPQTLWDWYHKVFILPLEKQYRGAPKVDELDHDIEPITAEKLREVRDYFKNHYKPRYFHLLDWINSFSPVAETKKAGPTKVSGDVMPIFVDKDIPGTIVDLSDYNKIQIIVSGTWHASWRQKVKAYFKRLLKKMKGRPGE